MAGVSREPLHSWAAGQKPGCWDPTCSWHPKWEGFNLWGLMLTSGNVWTELNRSQKLGVEKRHLFLSEGKQCRLKWVLFNWRPAWLGWGHFQITQSPGWWARSRKSNAKRHLRHHLQFLQTKWVKCNFKCLERAATMTTAFSMTYSGHDSFLPRTNREVARVITNRTSHPLCTALWGYILSSPEKSILVTFLSPAPAKFLAHARESVHWSKLQFPPELWYRWEILLTQLEASYRDERVPYADS